MHRETAGCVVMTRTFLADGGEASIAVHPTYRPDADLVAQRLKEMNLAVTRPVRGALPLGVGFASSTALTLLHLSGTRVRRLREVSEIIDWQVHRLEPSGVDFEAISRQRAGLFGTGQWRDVTPEPLDISAVLPADRSSLSLREAGGRVTAHAQRLVPIARRLAAGIERDGALDYPALVEYCQVLAAAGVYTPAAASAVEYALGQGAAAKAVGGLVNKAVIVVWPAGTAAATRRDVLARLASMGCPTLAERI